MKPGALLVSWWNTHRFTLLLAGVGILGTTIVLLRVAHGVGVSGDANYYIELARALSEGGRGLEWLWGRFSLVPYKVSASLVRVVAPTVSGFVAIFGGFAFDARSVAGPFNALAFGLTIIFTGHWLRASVRSRLPSSWGARVLHPSGGWRLGHEAVPLTVSRLEIGGAVRLIWAAVFSALACLTRYSGAGTQPDGPLHRA